MLNTVVLGEGISKSKYTPYFGHHSSFRNFQKTAVSECAKFSTLLLVPQLFVHTAVVMRMVLYGCSVPGTTAVDLYHGYYR